MSPIQGSIFWREHEAENAILSACLFLLTYIPFVFWWGIVCTAFSKTSFSNHNLRRRKSKFTEAQIIGILNEQSQQEQKVAEVCRKHGISEATFYNCRGKNAGMAVA